MYLKNCISRTLKQFVTKLNQIKYCIKCLNLNSNVNISLSLISIMLNVRLYLKALRTKATTIKKINKHASTYKHSQNI